MRRLIMWNLITLDGFFEGPKPWDLAWHEWVWGDELKHFSLEQAHTADLLLFGRATYEGMASYWPSATGDVADYMNSVPKVIFSRTLRRADWNNTRIVSADAPEEVAGLKAQPGNDILIFGSADLSAALTRRGLIDEYRIGLTPAMLEGGTPLFKADVGRLTLTLLEARPLRSGCVILRYEPAPPKGR